MWRDLTCGITAFTIGTSSLFLLLGSVSQRLLHLGIFAFQPSCLNIALAIIIDHEDRRYESSTAVMRQGSNREAVV